MAAPHRPDDRSPIGELTTTCDGVVLHVNRTLLRWVGRDAEDVEGRPMTTVLSAASQLFFETQYRALLRLHGYVDGVALDLRGPNGSPVPVLVAAVRHDPPGEDPVVHVRLFPAGARAAYERELRRSRSQAWRSESRLRLLHDLRSSLLAALEPRDVLQSLADGLRAHTRGGLVAIWLVADDGALSLQLGTPSETSPARLLPDDDHPATAVARTRDSRSFALEEVRERWPRLLSALAQAGREVLLLAPLPAENEIMGVVQVALRRDRPDAVDDLAALAALGAEAGAALLRCELPAHLQGLPLRDPLTGASTPALFAERVGGALARAADSGQPFALFLLDLAPTQGHAAAVPDPVIASRGGRLEGVGDSVARLGRSRFGVMREGCSPAEAHRWAGALQQALERSGPDQASLSVTVGGTVVEPLVDGRSVTVRDVLSWATSALAAAAARGPGRRAVHTASTRQAARALAQAERTVRRALAHDEVVLHYQPVVHLRTGRVLGVEALCRLRLPDGTLLQPVHFIDAAEESGLLVALGRRALETACGQQAAWASRGDDLDVAVNVSASQAAAPEFAEGVLDVLRTSGCEPRHLVLELTESALLAATPPTLESFAALRSEGVRVALDDFGTRYASLDYVRSFPLDELKIDQSFVAGLPGSRVARAIVRMVAQLAADLDLACVAEGIETAAQAQFLDELGVLGQGFAVGHPVPSEDIVTWLTPASWLTGSPPPFPEVQQA